MRSKRSQLQPHFLLPTARHHGQVVQWSMDAYFSISLRPKCYDMQLALPKASIQPEASYIIWNVSKMALEQNVRRVNHSGRK